MLSNIMNVANNNGLNTNAYIFIYSSKIIQFMSLRHISLNNTKNTNHRHISLPGTDLCKYLILKVQPLSLFYISENLQEN